MDPVWRLLMNDWLCAHAGVISTSQLLAFGCERRMVCRMVERHELVPMFAGVFRSAHWPHGRDQLMTAACVGNPNAVVAFTSAASLWGFGHSLLNEYPAYRVTMLDLPGDATIPDLTIKPR